MRCLQCGKAIPLFKRLGGSSEFCSDAHRKEYQREYSQLALGRLMQSHSSEKAQPVPAPPVPSVSAPAVVEAPAAIVKNTPAVNGAPAWAEKTHSAPTPYAPAAKPNGIPKSQPPPPVPVKKAVPLPAAPQPATAKVAESHPAIAKPAAIQKPAPAELQFALAGAPEFEHAFASLAPDRPRREADMSSAELPQCGAIAWDSGVEIATSITRPMEHKLDLREVPRTTPRIALDLRIVPPESLETESRPLTVLIVLAEPDEASLWIGPHRDFAGELASLSGFTNDQFSKSDFEVPALSENPAIATVPEPLPAEPQPAAAVAQPMPQAASPVVSAVPETLLTEPQPAAVEIEPRLQAATTIVPAVPEPLLTELQPAAAESEPAPQETHSSVAESETIAPTPTVRAPEPELTPLPVNSTGIAAGRAKPLPVFGPVLVSAGTVQIPQPNGLPLRPLMVLATPAPTAAVKTDSKNRKASIFSLGSALSAAPNLGLPEPPVQAPEGPMASPMRKILAALTGAAVLGAGIFLFLGKQSNAGLKSSTPAAANGAAGGQWIADFAPDAKRQRRVSLLRSSVNLPAYRLDFESSIQMKALGWVYRARDSKNFYVSKIEFQKPGVSPVYALVHFAVINGVEQPRVETPLHTSVPMGGVYKIRFEAAGNRFTTWVQGQRVEQWTDARLSSGGAGLYGEGAEQSVLHGDFVVTPLLK